MPRVASLYLPNLPTDRLRRAGFDTSHELPLITVHKSGSRMVIAAACRVALSLGLHPNMALTHARALIPELEVRNADHEGDAAFLHRLGLFAARRWTPRASVSGGDGLWLDLTGVSHLFGGERRMCVRIIHFCRRLGFSARIAVAGTTGAAHALARYGPNGITICPSGQEATAVAPLPLAALRMDDDVLSSARRLGIDRVGDLISMPRAPLNRRFGKTLLARLDQTLGRTGEPFDPIVPAEPPSALLRLVEPVSTAEAIEQVLFDLLNLLTSQLEQRGLGARTITLLCNRIDGHDQQIAIGTAQATRDGKHLLRLFKMKIEKIEPGFGIEGIQLVATRCEPLRPQPIDSGLSGTKPAPDLAPLIDQLASRLGSHRIFRSSAVESDVPERSVRRVSPLGSGGDWPGGSWPPHWPRPAMLLSPPEPVQKVLAELPDQPPVRFTWRGKMYHVRKADGPERIYGEWWKRTHEADAVRDYFQVEDESGARFWLYRRGDGTDRRTGDLRWYMHGLFG